MNYKDVLCISKNIMKNSTDFLKDKNIESMTMCEKIEFYEIFYIDFNNLIDFLVKTPYFTDIMFKYFSESGINLGDENKFYMDYLKNSIHDYDKWGRDNYNRFITINKF